MARKLQNLEDLRKVPPNWKYWGRMHEITLPEAIALSFNVEPSADLIEFGDWSDRRDYRFNAEDMQERLRLALSHLRPGGGLRRTDLSLTGSSTLDWRNFTFVTSMFGSWAQKLNFDIPDEFPRSPLIPTAQEQSKVDQLKGQDAVCREDSLTYMTEEVKMIIEASKLAHANNIHDSKSLQLLIEKVAKDRLPYPLPDVALEQFAIAIRPEERAFKDPRSRKRPHGSPPKKPETRDRG